MSAAQTPIHARRVFCAPTFSATGAWIDFVYGYVSLEGAEDTVDEAVPTSEPEPQQRQAAMPA